jgi:hypothetical protein
MTNLADVTLFFGRSDADQVVDVITDQAGAILTSGFLATPSCRPVALAETEASCEGG